MLCSNEQAGTGPSRRHIQGSKIAKGLPSVNLQYSKIEKPKNGPSGALKGGHFRNCQHFCRSWRGDPLEKKQIFEKSLTMPKNWKGGPFGVFQHPFCRKTSKNWRGENFYFRKKISQCRKKLWKGGPFGIFRQFCRKTAKKIEGTLWGKIFFRKKVSQCREKIVRQKKRERGTL